MSFPDPCTITPFHGIIVTVSTSIAIYRGDSSDVARKNPHNSVCVAPLSQNGKAPQGGIIFVGALIQNTTRRRTGPSKA